MLQDNIKMELYLWDMRVWTGLITPVTSACEHYKKPLGALKVG
jgi:hypothetical protein